MDDLHNSPTDTLLHAVIEQSPFSTLVFHPDGSVAYVNEASSRVWGATPEATEFIRTHYNILKDEQLRAKGVMPMIEKAFTGEPSYVPEIYYDHKDTNAIRAIKDQLHPTWIIGHLWPIKDNDGHLKHVVLMHEDITLRKQAEERLVEEKQRAEEIKNEVISLASHQLRTPLTIIRWYSEMFLDSKKENSLNEAQRGHIQKIYEGAKRMADVLNTMLSVAELDARGVVAELTTVNLRAVIDTVVAQMEQASSVKKITLNTNYEMPDITLTTDQKLLDIVLGNVVANAIKYSKEGGRVEIRAGTQAAKMVISVHDHGIGIKDSDKEKIFQKMFRAPAAITLDPDGNGLGLYTAKLLAKKLGGDIRFDSKEGQGTVFYIELPCRSASA